MVGGSIKTHLKWPNGLMSAVIIGALAPALLGMAWVVSRSVSSPLQMDAPVAPLVVPIGSAVRDTPISAQITVERSDPFQVLSPTSGVVTGVHVSDGDKVSAGDQLVAVDDRLLVAFTGDAPLWRDLALGDVGQDVDRLRSYLSDLGFEAGTVPGRVTPATTEGIRQFNAALGRAATDRTAHREALPWIGAESMLVDEVMVRVGDVVGEGGVLMTGPAEPIAVLVELPEGQAVPNPPYVLTVGDVHVHYESVSGRITEPEAVAAVAAALRGADEGVGTVRPAEPEHVGTLPAAAVITDTAGRTCVFDSVEGAPIAIDVFGGSLSTVEVSSDWIGRPVLVNPRELREDLACG